MNLHDILVLIELTKTCININKSQFNMSDIKIMNYIYDFDDMHFKTIKIVKIIN